MKCIIKICLCTEGWQWSCPPGLTVFKGGTSWYLNLSPNWDESWRKEFTLSERKFYKHSMYEIRYSFLGRMTSSGKTAIRIKQLNVHIWKASLIWWLKSQKRTGLPSVEYIYWKLRWLLKLALRFVRFPEWKLSLEDKQFDFQVYACNLLICPTFIRLLEQTGLSFSRNTIPYMGTSLPSRGYI